MRNAEALPRIPPELLFYIRVHSRLSSCTPLTPVHLVPWTPTKSSESGLRKYS